MKVCPNCGKLYPDDANFCPTDAGRLEIDPGDTARGHAPAGSSEVPVEDISAAVGGRFDLVAMIGGGPTGTVYQATDRETGQACAVKLVQPGVFPNPLLLQRAERELKQLERVHLPEVARILGHGRQGDQLWIAMELFDGIDLVRRMMEGGPLPALAACHLIRQVAHGLAEAAKQGVIHRDLAAKNVLVGHGDTVKIINFPIAVPFSDRVQGVPEFLSPEQVEGKPADQRSSIYSLGALLYFAVTGRPPFSGQPADVHRAHVAAEPVRASQLAPVPEAVEAVILKALEKASAKRFMTLHQMIGELDSVLAGAVAAAELARPGSAHGKVKPSVGPAQTLVGVAAFQVPTSGPPAGPGGPVGGSSVSPSMAMHAPMVAAPLAAPLVAKPMVPAPGPSILDVDMGRPLAASGELNFTDDAGRVVTPMPLDPPPHPEPYRPPAVIVPTPPPSPAISINPAAATGRGKAKVSTVPPASDSKGKFRETMWFKKGELDEAAAAHAAAAQTGELVHDKADALPIEDRYADDGTLDRRDAERLSLRTGATGMMQAQRAEPLARKRVSERELVGELKRGRIWMFLFLLAVAGAIGGAVYYFAN
ncbi:MAG TPA: serine/threonine-protein kinase [Kofleriaceae bacterium]|nr:serine/threonine-protein kinase [Kofleriaceae bacterium]